MVEDWGGGLPTPPPEAERGTLLCAAPSRDRLRAAFVLAAGGVVLCSVIAGMAWYIVGLFWRRLGANSTTMDWVGIGLGAAMSVLITATAVVASLQAWSSLKEVPLRVYERGLIWPIKPGAFTEWWIPAEDIEAIDLDEDEYILRFRREAWERHNLRGPEGPDLIKDRYGPCVDAIRSLVHPRT